MGGKCFSGCKKFGTKTANKLKCFSRPTSDEEGPCCKTKEEENKLKTDKRTHYLRGTVRGEGEEGNNN